MNRAGRRKAAAAMLLVMLGTWLTPAETLEPTGETEPPAPAAAETTEREEPAYELAAESGSLALYIDRTSRDFIGMFKVVDRTSGYSWYSNPPEADEDPSAKGKPKMELFSNLIIGYVNPEKKTTDTSPSRTGSVNKKGASVTLTENGARIVYDFPGDGFTVPMTVELKDGSLRVAVEFSEIREYGENRLYTLRLLPYFGAVYREAEEGYVFVPEGSGALMYFNNGKSGYKAYSEKVYGQDINVEVLQQQEQRQVSRLPVFGIKAGQNAFAAVIEEGDANAFLEASTAGKNTGYNNVSAGFTVRSTDNYTFGSAASSLSQSTTVYEEGPIGHKKAALRYYFLQGDQADYAGMAAAYRRHLVGRGVLQHRTEGVQPLYLELLGGAVKQKSFLGFPTDRVEALTGFAEAETLLRELYEEDGLSNVKVRYLNWSKEMLWQRIADGATAASELGGARALSRLLETAEQTGGTVYLDTDYTSVARFGWWDGAYFSAAHTVSGTTAKTYIYQLHTFYPNPKFPTQYLLSLKKQQKAAGEFLKDMQKRYGTAQISLGNLGSVLFSDYRTAGESRQTAADVRRAIGESYAQAGRELMLTGGNAYMLGSASHILHIPTTGNFDMFDEAVPFYAMVLHGYLSFAGDALNLSENPQKDFLKTVEMGGALCYAWFTAPSERLQGTAYTSWYSGDPEYWRGDAAARYAQLDALYRKTASAEIIGHRRLENGVYATSYDNGVVTVVNYTDRPVQTDFGTVEAAGYLVSEKENAA